MITWTLLYWCIWFIFCVRPAVRALQPCPSSSCIVIWKSNFVSYKQIKWWRWWSNICTTYTKWQANSNQYSTWQCTETIEFRNLKRGSTLEYIQCCDVILSTLEVHTMLQQCKIIYLHVLANSRPSNHTSVQITLAKEFPDFRVLTRSLFTNFQHCGVVSMSDQWRNCLS